MKKVMLTLLLLTLGVGAATFAQDTGPPDPKTELIVSDATELELMSIATIVRADQVYIFPETFAASTGTPAGQELSIDAEVFEIRLLTLKAYSKARWQGLSYSDASSMIYTGPSLGLLPERSIRDKLSYQQI